MDPFSWMYYYLEYNPKEKGLIDIRWATSCLCHCHTKFGMPIHPSGRDRKAVKYSFYMENIIDLSCYL